MDNEQVLRIKSAMILYSLETALGKYVLNAEILDNLTDKSRDSIIQREKSKGRDIEKDNVSMLVESSYLDEVFDLAIEVTESTSLHPLMKQLKSFCSYLDIFDIRNSISHPNRPFPDAYWFRAASIASDPLILKLGLLDVRQALNSALTGNVNPPPDEWINNVKWAIPNSLPDSFDHEITGLLGRDKEFKDLESTLSKVRNNLIALVAPGGVGKTALILQFLKDISLSPKWSETIDAIVFCTLKNERLTADGIELIEAINGIDQVKDSILDDLKLIYPEIEINSFEDACSLLDSEKILICIDNLETLLVSSQEEFISFNQSLPLFWRVIVTSRISIDSATTVPLQALGKRHAVTLARNYFKKRGINDFKQEDLEVIAHQATNNPLAIRLTIDLYLRGVDISQSMHQSQKDIAAFSYTNLIESLRTNSISILEAIYVTGEATKSQLIDILDLSNDEISESINELSKTSLLVRSTSETGNDKFDLSDSIRDLLLTNPKNIEIRSKISDSLKDRRNKIQEQRNRNQQLGITEFEEEYISENLDSSIHGLIVDLNKYLTKPHQKRNHSDLIALKNRFSDLIAYNTTNHELFYHYSRILKELKDSPSELMILNQAIKYEPNSQRYLKAKALNFFYNSNYPDAITIFEDLVTLGFDHPENSSRKFSSSLKKLNLLCLLNLGDYPRIFSETAGWDTDPNWSVLMGTYRASAFKRSVELTRDSKEKEEALSESIDIFNQIFKDGDYSVISCVEAHKLVKDFLIIINNKDNYTEPFLHKFIEFIAEHFFNIVSTLKGMSIESHENKSLLERINSISLKQFDNPLQKSRWYVPEKEQYYDQEHIQELLEDGYDMVKIYHIPEGNFGMSNYVFAKNAKEEEFYLHVDDFESGWNRWGYVSMADKLAIKYARKSHSGATRASKIVEIDKYEM